MGKRYSHSKPPRTVLFSCFFLVELHGRPQEAVTGVPLFNRVLTEA